MKRRRRAALLAQMANEQAGLVSALLNERSDLIVAGRCDPVPLPAGLEARIEGGWVTMRRLERS